MPKYPGYSQGSWLCNLNITNNIMEKLKVPFPHVVPWLSLFGEICGTPHQQNSKLIICHLFLSL